jgi:mono/diheme cytochrome c family protein
MAANRLALGLALLLAACGLPPGTANDPSGGSSSGGSSSGGSVSEGARLYAAKCARCHGELTVSAFRNATAAQIVARHRNLVTDAEAAAIADALSNRPHAWSGSGGADFEGVSSGGEGWDASER